LYSQMIDLLCKDKVWDLALKLWEERVDDSCQSCVIPDKNGLYEVLKQPNAIQESLFYRVVFSGKGFPEFLQGKKFVYKSKEVL
jgi:pentatricopeptide repeat protein